MFDLSPEDAKVTKLVAWNQGFYNLLLAIAIVAGWLLRNGVVSMNDGVLVGNVLILYGLASICIVGIVLFVSALRLWRSALVQLVLALIALIVLVRN